MKFSLSQLSNLFTLYDYDEAEQKLKSMVSERPETEVIPGDLHIEISLVEEKGKLSPDDFKLFKQVVSYFEPEFYKEKEWLECYDKLIRLDKYSEEAILYIVRYFRNEDSWWAESGNFRTLLKLRRLDKEKVKYIDIFADKIRKDRKAKRHGFAPGTIIHKQDGKERGY